MRIALLGPLEVLDGDRAVAVGGTRLKALLVRLALEPGRVISTSALIEELWGENPPADAANALQSLVSRLRRSLGPASTLLTSNPVGYALQVEPDEVDAHEFTDLAHRGRRLLDEHRTGAAAETLRRALALWRGPAFTDIADIPFAGPTAERFAELELTARTDRIAADLELGHHHEVVPELETLLAAHPLRERLSGLLMTALYRSGRQADALTRYESTRAALAENLGVDPSEELQRIHLDLLRGELTATAAPVQTNLRSQLTSFFGREAEVGCLVGALSRGRLVTIVGPGGAGKTRLASETAATLVHDNPDGVWFVALASIGDAVEIEPAVLSALGGRETSLLDRRLATTADVEDRLISHIGEHRILMVLDNCEHLIAAVAQLADTLLAACPQLRILATSREPLGITGEALAPIPPLGLPGADATEDALASAPAVRLFLDRARAVRPDLVADLHTVQSICAALDGMPLAIELAAARLRSLSLEQIHSRLGDRFRLLSAGSRTALPRHRTLRAVVDWSWELLEHSERLVAQRISMFPGGAALEAIEQLCAGEMPAPAVLDAVTGLVDKSLVEVDGDRYRMLETIRAYAGEALQASGDYDRVRTAYTAYFRAWTRSVEPRLRSAEQVEWMGRLVEEQDNVRAALRLSLDRPDAPAATELAASMCWFWALRGSHAESASWLREVLELPRSEVPPAARAVVDLCYGVNPLVNGLVGIALRPVAEARRIARHLDLNREHPLLTLIETGIATIREQYELAWDELARAFAHPDPWAGAFGSMLQGQLKENLGDIDGAEAHLDYAAAHFKQIGDRWGMASSLSALSRIRAVRGNLDGAIEADTTSLAMTEELGALDDVPQILGQRARHRIFLGDVQEAARDAERALTLGANTGHPEGILYSSASMALVERARGQLAAARCRLEECRRAIVYTGFAAELGRAFIDLELAYLELAADDADAAQAAALSAIRNGILDMTFVAPATEALAEIARRAGDPARSVTLHGVAHSLRGAPDASRPEVRRSVAALRAELTAEEFENAYARGRTMTREQAIAEIDPDGGAQARRR